VVFLSLSLALALLLSLAHFARGLLTGMPRWASVIGGTPRELAGGNRGVWPRGNSNDNSRCCNDSGRRYGGSGIGNRSCKSSKSTTYKQKQQTMESVTKR
jgi:hypothetical protein